MNKKVILLIAAMLISVAAFAFIHSKRKKDDEIVDDGLPDIIQQNKNTGIVPPNTQQQIAAALKAAAIAGPAIKAIGNVVKDILADHVDDVVSNQMQKVAENVATDVIAKGGTIADGAEAAMKTTSEQLAKQAAEIGAGTATTTTGGTTAAGATTGATLLSVAVPLVILGGIIAWAVSMGVFDMTDWTPPYGQVPLKLNAYGASVAGLHEGDVVMVTPDVMNKILADTSDNYLYSYLEANRHATEAKQAAIEQNQRQLDAQQSTAEAAAAAAEAARQAQIAADNAATEQARIDAQRIADQLAEEKRLADIAAANAIQAASEQVRQGIALKATGNVGTQYNYELSEFEEL